MVLHTTENEIDYIDQMIGLKKDRRPSEKEKVKSKLSYVEMREKLESYLKIASLGKNWEAVDGEKALAHARKRLEQINGR